MTILIDANILCGYADSGDIHHKNANKIIKEISSGIYGKAVITDYIFDEIVNVYLRKFGKKNAVDLGKFIINSEIFFINVDKLVFQKAWELFQKDNNLSLTDCTSVTFMLLYNIDRIATLDKEFKTIKGIEVVDS
ncbi:MAG TPA: PIN domain-containing protein [Candidatus Nanoarchaeia archaeon]|nr:PIN domain-containing protein [Candidatus Nanoarchaeia archaeon]